MITHIKVNGFKSLVNFEMDLRPGLNVLVGPNGSGKSNIIEFLEFFNDCTSENQIGDVVSAHGSSLLFTKTGKNTFANEISFEVTGTYSRPSILFSLDYCYSATLILESSGVSFQEQRLVWMEKYSNSESVENEQVFDWNIRMQTENPKQRPFVFTYKNKFHGNLYELRFHYLKNKCLLKEIYDATFELVPYYLSLALHFEFQLKGTFFSVSMEAIKQVNNVATRIGISKFGARLTRTLYAVKYGEPISGFDPLYFSSSNLDVPSIVKSDSGIGFSPDTMPKILDLLRDANPQILEILLTRTEDDQINMRFRMGNGAELPLTSMSDGTLKWLCLITAILIDQKIGSIDEPENLLHPWMQNTLVNLLRDYYGNSPIFIATHSETIINACSPNEIVLVNVDPENGGTVAQRPKYAQKLKEQISESGFGLGTFYYSNAIL